MVKIYTKTGDAGETSLLGGARVSKDCVTLRVVGEVDELNSVLGQAVAHLYEEEPADFLQKIQCDLFKVGAELASLQMQVNSQTVKVGEEEIQELEKTIDEYWEQLPELKNFILPGGNNAGATLHYARSLCRRTERELVALGKEQKIRPELYQYFNRLSDFLFAAARLVNAHGGVGETIV
jgi:cob(I)alamin adenosyltransferase